MENEDATQLEGSTQEVQEASTSSTTEASSTPKRPAARTLTTLKKKRRKGKDTPEKPTFEEMFMSIQDRQLKVEEEKVKADDAKSSIENRVTLMREVRSLQNEGFTNKEILGLFPEAKGMLE